MRTFSCQSEYQSGTVYALENLAKSLYLHCSFSILYLKNLPRKSRITSLYYGCLSIIRNRERCQQNSTVRDRQTRPVPWELLQGNTVQMSLLFCSYCIFQLFCLFVENCVNKEHRGTKSLAAEGSKYRISTEYQLVLIGNCSF